MNDDTRNDLMPVDEVMRNELESLITDSFKAARESFDPNSPMAWLPQWYLAQWTKLDAIGEALTVQYNRMKAQIVGRRKALDWKWGRDFHAQVVKDLDVQPGNKRSVDYLTGRAGFRKSGGGATLLVTDEAAVIKAADGRFPQLLKKTLDRPAIREYLEGGDSVPGVTLVQTDAKDSFFPSVTQPLLGQGDTEDASQDSR